MNAREALIEATKTLLWQKGYEATSPRDIQARAGVGQGSFYHHFSGKEDLARAAVEDIVADRIASFDAAMAAPGSFRKRVLAYAGQNHQPLCGCRVGRLVWDAAVDSESLRAPLARYFQHLEQGLIAALETGVATGRMRLALPAPGIALIVLTTIQGNYTLGRALQQPRLDETLAALGALLDQLVNESGTA